MPPTTSPATGAALRGRPGVAGLSETQSPQTRTLPLGQNLQHAAFRLPTPLTLYGALDDYRDLGTGAVSWQDTIVAMHQHRVAEGERRERVPTGGEARPAAGLVDGDAAVLWSVTPAAHESEMNVPLERRTTRRSEGRRCWIQL